MDKIVINASPVRFSKITVIKENSVKEVATAMPKDLAGVVMTLSKTYSINAISIAGPESYTKQLGFQINNANQTMFKKPRKISIDYIKGV